MNEEKEVSHSAHAVRYGIIGGLLCVVVSVILYIADLQFESWARWLSFLVMVLTIVLSLRSLSQEYTGREIGFGTLFGAGMIITALIAAITTVYFFIYISTIDPDFIANTLEVSRQKMIENGMTETQIEKALEMSRKIMTPGLMGGIAAFTTVLLGALVSVISAAVFKQEK